MTIIELLGLILGLVSACVSGYLSYKYYGIYYAIAAVVIGGAFGTFLTNCIVYSLFVFLEMIDRFKAKKIIGIDWLSLLSAMLCAAGFGFLVFNSRFYPYMLGAVIIGGFFGVFLVNSIIYSMRRLADMLDRFKTHIC